METAKHLEEKGGVACTGVVELLLRRLRIVRSDACDVGSVVLEGFGEALRKRFHLRHISDCGVSDVDALKRDGVAFARGVVDLRTLFLVNRDLCIAQGGVEPQSGVQ